MIPVIGDRIVFLGDSITEQQLYTNYVEAYLASRFPRLKLSFHNAGWGGDTAPGGVRRLARDVLALKPTLVTICYGMNDGRYMRPTPQIAADYETGLRELLAQLRAAGVRAVVLTPGVVDYDRNPNLRACDYNTQGLRILADTALKVAAEAGVPGYDLHKLMLDVQTRAKAADPAFTMIPDSVHPDPAGQLVMAYGLLEALGVPERDGEVRIDARARKATAGAGVRKAAVRGRAEALTIELQLEELPFFVEPLARKILPFLPFRQRFDGLRLVVENLPAELWQLRCGGQRLPLSREELATGLAIAELDGTAAVRRAATVHAFTREKDRLYFTAWRQLALFGANGPEYLPQAHLPVAEATRKLDRARDRLLDRPSLKLTVSLLRSDSAGDLITDGDFIAWWRLRGPVTGPFRNDHLDGEAGFSANPRLDSNWIQATVDTEKPQDCLNQLLGKSENCCAYALAVLESPVAQDAELLLGSDDGFSAWLNGELLADRLELARGCVPDSDRLPVRLRAGRNHLLLKINQYGGAWGFCARFAGLKQAVAILRA